MEEDGHSGGLNGTLHGLGNIMEFRSLLKFL